MQNEPNSSHSVSHGQPSFLCEPPPSNTGVPHTSREALVDWVSFTLRGENPVGQALSLLRAASAQPELGHGRFGYRRSLQVGSALILFEGREDMGASVQIPGSGCRDIEAADWFEGWPALLGQILAAGGQFTRVDVALDERDGILDLEELSAKIDRQEFTCRARTWEERKSWSVKLGRWARTFYFGQLRGEKLHLVRIYDKAAEQNEHGHWVRTELEVRKQKAHSLAQLIAASDGNVMDLVCGALADLVTLREPSEDTNKARWAMWAPWRQLLDDAQRLPLRGRQKIAEELVASMRWLKQQCSAKLVAVIVDLEDDSEEFMRELLATGYEKLWSRAARSEWRREQAAKYMALAPF